MQSPTLTSQILLGATRDPKRFRDSHMYHVMVLGGQICGVESVQGLITQLKCVSKTSHTV